MIKLACLEAQRHTEAKEEQGGSQEQHEKRDERVRPKRQEKPRGSRHIVEEMRSVESGQSAKELQRDSETHGRRKRSEETGQSATEE